MLLHALGLIGAAGAGTAAGMGAAAYNYAPGVVGSALGVGNRLMGGGPYFAENKQLLRNKQVRLMAYPGIAGAVAGVMEARKALNNYCISYSPNGNLEVTHQLEATGDLGLATYYRSKGRIPDTVQNKRWG